jgi:predicted lipoprotein with Yx(FWY)xxD motif
MNTTKALLAALTLLPLAAACGSSDNSTVSSSGSSAPTASASSPADAGNDNDSRYGYGSQTGSTSATTLKLTTSALGTYLTDSSGRTLYLFEKDGTDVSRCAGACTAAWPPVEATSVGAGLQASLLKQVTRADGTKQSSYGGHPLYYYAGDAGPGQTHGEGLDEFGAKWYVLDAHGKKIDSD